MKRWWLVIVLLLSVGVNVGVLSIVAAHRWGKKPPGQVSEPAAPLPQGAYVPERVVQLADRLGLEGEPRHRFITLQANFFAETVRLRTEQAEIQRGLRHELIAPKPDPARIEARLRESAQAFLEIEKALATNVVESRKLLSPEQDELFLRFLARLRQAALGIGGAQPGQAGPLRGGAAGQPLTQPMPRNQRRPGMPGMARPDRQERWQPQQRPGGATERPLPPRQRWWQRRFGGGGPGGGTAEDPRFGRQGRRRFGPGGMPPRAPADRPAPPAAEATPPTTPPPAASDESPPLRGR